MNEKKQVEYNPPKGKKEFSTTRPKRRPQKRKNDGQKKQTNLWAKKMIQNQIIARK